MDSSHSSLPVHGSDTRHTKSQPQSLPHNLTHVPTERELPPPSKRRRSNSGTPSTAPTVTSPIATTTLPPSSRWQANHTHSLYNPDRRPDSFPPRNTSPDQSSHVSATSSLPLNGPQLRKKPKSSSIKNTNLLRAASAAILTSPSLPAFHTSANIDRETTYKIENNILGSVGHPLTRANSGPSQHQSPNQKRPPASHSSYGVETTCGPPPSYSTQRTFSQERIKKPDRNSSSRTQLSTSDFAQVAALDEPPDAYTQKKESVPSLIHSSPDTTDTQSIPTPTEVDNMANIRIRGEQRTSTDEDGKASSSDERRSEDLFLNIARVDAARPPQQPKAEKRRSRISIPFLPSSRSVQANRVSPEQPRFDPDTAYFPLSEVPPFHSKRSSLGGQMSNAHSSRSHLVDSGRLREHSVDVPSDHERNEGVGYGVGLRRASTTNTESTRLAQRSSAGLRSNRLVSESPQAERPRTGEHITTESTISTTAPSTVWDELDDLKSRIRKLELTGKLPPSSAAAMGSTERPRTATTAATTMSTSPKYKPSEPNLQASAQTTVQPTPSPIHPLLYEALDNARAVINPEIYRKLQATAQDALQIAAIMNNDSIGNKTYGTSLGNERQMKKCTESMCRSLTELAIALAAEVKPAQSAARPASRDQNLPPNSMLRSRRYSNDPADRGPATSRVQSRLDSRRTSVHLGRGGTGYSSPEHGFSQSPGPAAQLSEPRINRSSAQLRKRGQGSFDGVDDQYDASPSIRPGSRAMTDLGSYRRISRDQMQSPREYTSQHPLPSQQEQAAIAAAISTPLPAGHNPSFTSRRKYASSGGVLVTQDNNPITPREAWGRISTMPVDTQSPDVVSEAGGPNRMGSSRRSLGFSGRIGSSVGSRLRAVRAERNSRENLETGSRRDSAPALHDDRTTTAANFDVYQTGNAR